MKEILLDCDGVILDYFSVIHDRYDHKINHNGRKTTMNDFRDYFNLHGHEVDEFVTEFNNSEDFEFIPAYENSKEVLNNLYKDGYKIYVITSCGNSEQTTQRRIKNLHTEIGDIFEEIICLGLEEPKDDILVKWKDSNCLWVDDRPFNCEAGLKLGLDSLMYKTIYNEHLDFPKANDWNHLDKIIRLKYEA